MNIDHLSADMQRFVRRIRRRWSLSDHHIKLLVLAAEAHDRSVQARNLLAREGITATDRHGQVRPHPAIGIERDSRIGFARLLRELGLSDDGTSDSRPPRPQGRYQGRP